MLRVVVCAAVLAMLAACSSTATPSASPSVAPSLIPFASPGDPLGALPGVEGFGYRLDLDSIPGFVGNARESVDGGIEIRVIQSAIATRGDDAVSVIAFGFPGATDTEAVDAFAQVLDAMEDGFGAGSQRGLGGAGYVMTADGRTVALAPWGRLDYLVFLFAQGPTGATEDVVTGILDAP